MDIILRPWRHYADFDGRSSRTEYWLFFITLYGAIIVLAMFAGLLDEASGGSGVSVLFLILLGVGVLAALIPSWSVTIRRLHDQDKSGWMVLLTFIPFIGWIFGLIFAFTPGTEGENEYGPDPRDRSAGVAEVFS